MLGKKGEVNQVICVGLIMMRQNQQANQKGKGTEVQEQAAEADEVITKECVPGRQSLRSWEDRDLEYPRTPDTPYLGVVAPAEPDDPVGV